MRKAVSWATEPPRESPMKRSWLALLMRFSATCNGWKVSYWCQSGAIKWRTTVCLGCPSVFARANLAAVKSWGERRVSCHTWQAIQSLRLWRLRRPALSIQSPGSSQMELWWATTPACIICQWTHCRVGRSSSWGTATATPRGMLLLAMVRPGPCWRTLGRLDGHPPYSFYPTKDPQHLPARKIRWQLWGVA